MAASGTATLDFGAFPGAPEASIAVASSGIVAGSLVEAWRMPTVDTADPRGKFKDEQMVERFKVVAADIVAGVGFTIYGTADPVTQLRGTNANKLGQDAGPVSTRGWHLDFKEPSLIDGKYLIGWAWS